MRSMFAALPARRAAAAVAAATTTPIAAFRSAATPVRQFDLSPLPPALRSQWHAENTTKMSTTIEPTSTRAAMWRCQACDGVFRRRVDTHVRRAGECPHCAHVPGTQANSKTATQSSEADAKALLSTLLSETPDVVAAALTDELRDIDRARVPQFLRALREAVVYVRSVELTLSPNARRILLEQTALQLTEECRRLRAQAEKPAKSTELTPMTAPPQRAANAPQRDVVPATPKSVLDRGAYAPMLAYAWERYEHLVTAKTPLFVSRKLDGVRCIAVWDARRRQPVFLSRNGNPFESADRVVAAVTPLFERDPALVLDGELYVHGAEFGKLVGAVKASRSTRTAAHKRMQSRLQLHVFDVMHASKMDDAAPFSTRLAVLERKLATLPSSSSDVVRLVEQKSMRKRGLAAELDTAIEEGYEGLMVRVGDTPYEFGKRSMNLLKVKRMHDAEFEVVDVIEGKGRLRGMVGAIECVTNDEWNPQRFKAMFGVDDEERRQWWLKRKQLIGKLVTVSYQEITSAGVPRFGQFKCVRSDADGSGFV